MWTAIQEYQCSEFSKKLSKKEKFGLESFIAVVKGFLGNCKAKNYDELAETLMKTYSPMGCTISIKIHIFDSNLDKFKENMWVYSEEQREHFHQGICEHGYQGD